MVLSHSVIWNPTCSASHLKRRTTDHQDELKLIRKCLCKCSKRFSLTHCVAPYSAAHIKELSLSFAVTPCLAIFVQVASYIYIYG